VRRGRGVGRRRGVGGRGAAAGAPTASDRQRYSQQATEAAQQAATDVGTLIPRHSGQIVAASRATSTPGAGGWALPAGRRRNATSNQVISGMINSATMLATLIMGLIAGPAVSLYGSPTVSPVTAAAWASDPLPP
jgi:hypothetical protein